MTHSLNEIEALAKRAARGAGMAWGMAEETGRAVRWLSAHDLNGATALADLLDLNDRRAFDKTAPGALAEVWSAPSGEMCPISGGVALNDCADHLRSDDAIVLENVSHPLLLVPFAAWAAGYLGKDIKVSWAQMCVQTDGHGIHIDGSRTALYVSAAITLCCEVAEVEKNYGLPKMRGKIDRLAWDRLAAFAHRTYAPATDESRRLGAGAGLADND